MQGIGTTVFKKEAVTVRPSNHAKGDRTDKKENKNFPQI
jgi:hypothetical protein